jgi:hypothetical protein
VAIALPDDIAACAETRALMLRRHQLFVGQGMQGLPEIDAINRRLAEIRSGVERVFPISATRVTAVCEALAAQVLRIHELETEAVRQMIAAVA